MIIQCLADTGRKTLDVTQKANRCGTRRWKQWEDWRERREATNKERIKEVKVAVDDGWVGKK